MDFIERRYKPHRRHSLPGQKSPMNSEENLPDAA
jgi:hypothetical protein